MSTYAVIYTRDNVTQLSLGIFKCPTMGILYWFFSNRRFTRAGLFFLPCGKNTIVVRLLHLVSALISNYASFICDYCTHIYTCGTYLLRIYRRKYDVLSNDKLINVPLDLSLPTCRGLFFSP